MKNFNYHQHKIIIVSLGQSVCLLRGKSNEKKMGYVFEAIIILDFIEVCLLNFD